MAEDTTLHTEGERTYIVNPRGLFQSGEEAHRYRLKVPTFAGIEDVEQFISEYNETWDITQWPPWVALAQLRGALTGEAKPYGHRPSIDGIFVALRARFGITGLDARFRLQRLLRKEDTSLQDHALAVKRLARIAYSDLSETQRRRYMLEDFTQCINHPSLNHQLQAKGVTSIEAALREGEAYLQAQRLYETPQQVTRLQGRGPETILDISLNSATDRLITMMKWAMAAISNARSPATPLEAPRQTHGNQKNDRQGPQHPACPPNSPPPDSRNSQRPPRPCKPGKGSIQGRPRRAFVRTPRDTPHGWQTPHKTGRPERQRETFKLPLANRFSQLPETELAGEVHSDIGGELLTPPQKGPHPQRPRKPPKKRVPPRVAKTEHTEEVRVQPHGDSYFLPGKITGKDVTFLLDSGCTTNLLSRRVFKTLPLKERRELALYTGEPGTLADGSIIPFNGVIELTGRVRDQTIREIFVISPVEEDAILGMPFLKRHGCRIDFSRSALLMTGRERTCVDKSGRPTNVLYQAAPGLPFTVE